MKTMRFLASWGLITFLLLLSVVVVDVFFNLFATRSETPSADVLPTFSNLQLVLGFVSDSLRALLLCYLFPKFKQAGISLKEAVKFGLAVHAIMATLWLIFGYFDLKLKDPEVFLVYDGIIFFIQGILTGSGMHWLVKRKFL